MAAYKDTERNTWYVAFYYRDWQGNNKKKKKRGFKTKREALDWEKHSGRNKKLLWICYLKILWKSMRRI